MLVQRSAVLPAARKYGDVERIICVVRAKSHGWMWAAWQTAVGSAAQIDGASMQSVLVVSSFPQNVLRKSVGIVVLLRAVRPMATLLCV